MQQINERVLSQKNAVELFKIRENPKWADHQFFRVQHKSTKIIAL